MTSVLGFSTSACSVMGCGVPVLPVVGLALTGVSSGTLAFLGGLARIGTAVILVAVTVMVAWLGWLVSARPGTSAAGEGDARPAGPLLAPGPRSEFPLDLGGR